MARPADRIEKLEAEVARLNREADIQAAEIDKARARAGKWQSMVLDCEEYLKPGETPRQRMDRDRQDVLGLMRLLQMKSEKQEALEAKRDAAVAAALREAAALAESAMRCRSCGGVFVVKNPHTDETCPKGRADWDSAEPDEVADAILALIDAPADAALQRMLAEERAKGMEEAAGIAMGDDAGPYVRIPAFHGEDGCASIESDIAQVSRAIAAAIRARAAEVREGGA